MPISPTMKPLPTSSIIRMAAAIDVFLGLERLAEQVVEVGKRVAAGDVERSRAVIAFLPRIRP